MQPANTPFRLSRIIYPRSSILSIVLLVIVFTCFGIWADSTQHITQNLSAPLALPLTVQSVSVSTP